MLHVTGAGVRLANFTGRKKGSGAEGRTIYSEMKHAHLLLVLAVAVAVSGTAAFGAVVAPGVQLRQLTNDGRSSLGQGGGCSPAGNLVAYYRQVSPQTQELRVLDIATGKAQSVSDIGYPSKEAWSKDGSKLAFIFKESAASAGDAWAFVWDAATGKTTRTALRGKSLSAWPRWSPDGTRFAMKADGGISIAPVDGGPVAQVAAGSVAGSYNAYKPNLWSADGSRFLFRSVDAGGLTRLWTVDAQGRDLQPITKPMQNIVDFAWSYDGRRIAFAAGEGRSELERQRGRKDMWVMDADGGNLRQITHGTDLSLERETGYVLFDWTRDDRYLVSWFGRWWEADRGDDRYKGFILMDPASGEIAPILSYEQGTSEEVSGLWYGNENSWDGQGVAFIVTQATVTGPRGGEQRRTDWRTLLKVYSIAHRKLFDALVYWPDQDRLRLTSTPSWTSDNRHLVATQARIIGKTDGVEKTESDLYLVTLPETLLPSLPPPAPAEEAEKPAPTVEPATQVPAAPEQVAPAAPVGVVEIVIQNRRAAEVANLLPSDERGTFAVDDGRNSLFISADAPNLEALRLEAAAIDQPVPHIMVDVLVTELSKDAGKQLGLDWEYAKGRFGALLPLGDLGVGPGSIFYQGVGKLDREFFTTLSLLTETGKACVRANPRVLAVSGKEALITLRRTDNFFYQSSTDLYGRPSLSRSDISADTVLKITPVLLGNGRISVRVDATVDSFTFARANDLPDLTRRQASTEPVCGDGESIVIGGLTQEESLVSVQKTPLLGDLPLIGSLFRHTQRRTRESTLTIFITPRLVIASTSSDLGRIGSPRK